MVLLPLFAMVVGFALAIVILNHYTGAPTRRRHELVWSISFFLFGLGALTEVFGELIGWNDLLVRTYYISGAILAVVYLGLGEAMLLWPRAMRVAVGVSALFTVLTVLVVATAPVNEALLSSAAPWRALSSVSTFSAALAGIGNGVGTLLIVGGALYSAWIFWRKGIQRNRMIGCLLIALGTAVVAIGGSLAGPLGQSAWLYPPMAIGIAIIFVGYLQTTRVAVPTPVVQPS